MTNSNDISYDFFLKCLAALTAAALAALAVVVFLPTVTVGGAALAATAMSVGEAIFLPILFLGAVMSVLCCGCGGVSSQDYYGNNSFYGDYNMFSRPSHHHTHSGPTGVTYGSHTHGHQSNSWFGSNTHGHGVGGGYGSNTHGHDAGGGFGSNTHGHGAGGGYGSNTHGHQPSSGGGINHHGR